MAKIFIPSPLRKFSEGKSQVDTKGVTVKDALDSLFGDFPDLKNHIIDDKGDLRNFVNIFVNSENVRQGNGLGTEVAEATEVRIIPAIAGGSKDLPKLTPPEFSRYSRHLILPEIGVEGQQKLKNARVLIIGCGGLGSPTSLYLAAAGVGKLGLVDFDRVDESNLQRQILFGVDSLGESKSKIAKERLSNLNRHIEIVTYEERLTSENALNIVKNYDIVIDGTDNFTTRYLVNDACVLLNKINVYGSIFRFEGQASVFNYNNGPCYRCLYPEPPPPGLVPSCAEGGVLGVLPGIIGSLQATEVIKIITGAGTSLSGRFLLYDALDLTFNELKIEKNPDCVICGDNPTVTELIDYEDFCGVNEPEESFDIEEISVAELKGKLQNGGTAKVVDVREPHELQIANIEGTIHIPMNDVPGRIDELGRDDEILVLCRSGQRSARIADFLIKNDFKNVKNVRGGILAWSKEIDNSVPTY